METTPVSPKVTASAGGGGAGLAIGVIVVWILTSNGVVVPEPVATSIGALLSIALGTGAAYLKRDRLRDVGKQVTDAAAVDPDGRDLP